MPSTVTQSAGHKRFANNSILYLLSIRHRAAATLIRFRDSLPVMLAEPNGGRWDCLANDLVHFTLFPASDRRYQTVNSLLIALRRRLAVPKTSVTSAESTSRERRRTEAV
jgi:hypothetical protein